MRRALLLLPLLAGCAPAEPLRGPAVMPDPGCRAVAQQDPEVRAIARAVNPMNPELMRRLASDRAAAEQRAYDACARERGLPLPGGVEPLPRS